MPRILTVLCFLTTMAALAAGRAGAQSGVESFDLFSDEGDRSFLGGAPAPGLEPEKVDAIDYFSLTPEASRSMRDASPIPREVRIALPGGGYVICRFPSQPDDAGAGGTMLLQGEMEGAGVGEHCDLVIKDGQVYGQIQTLTGRYRIVPVDGTEHAIAKIRTRGIPRGGEPLVPEEPRAPHLQRTGLDMPQQRDADKAWTCDAPNPVGGLPRAFGPIRVMVLYTAEARNMVADIDAEIALMMQQLRYSFGAQATGGNFSIMVELAHKQLVNYRQSEAQNVGQDLNRLSNPADPFFNFVPALKRQHRTDLVALLVGDRGENIVGIAWKPPSALPMRGDVGFSVTEIGWATNIYTFVHELGHNFGLHHDRGVVAPSAQMEGSYNYGFTNPDRGVISVMAYEDVCYEQGKTCVPLPVFSNPRVTVAGSPFGRRIAEADAAYNAEALCKAAPAVAAYRFGGAEFSIFNMHENYALNGRELARSRDVSLEECAQACYGNTECHGYDYDKWNRWCFQKAPPLALRLEPKSVAGVYFEMNEPRRLADSVTIERYRGRHFPGAGYQTTRESSFEACETSCRGDPHCVAYTYHKAENRCEAFASTGEYFSRVGADSGVKRQLPRQ